MARNKQPTKKQITDENDLLKKRLQELEAQIASQRPTSASQAADGQPSAHLQALTDENYDPWTDPIPNSNLGATLVKSPIHARAGSTRTTSGRVLADVTQAPPAEPSRAKSLVSNNRRSPTARVPPHQQQVEDDNDDDNDDGNDRIDLNYPSWHYHSQDNDDNQDDFDYYNDDGLDGDQLLGGNDEDDKSFSDHETDDDYEHQPGYDPSDNGLSRRAKKPKQTATTVDLDLENNSNPYICYNAEGLIAKPPGEPGRASTTKKKGYCLRRAMGYPPELPEEDPGRKDVRWIRKNKAYNFIHKYARQLIDLCFEPGVPYYRQELARRVKAEKAWLARFPDSPKIYEKNWPMDAIFSTILQNYNKKLKSGKSKKASGEEFDEDNPFAISLPGGKVLGNPTQELAEGDDSSETDLPPTKPSRSNTKAQLAPSSRSIKQGSSGSSSRGGPTASSSRPQPSSRDHRTSSNSAGSSPVASRARGRAATQLGFTLAQDPPPKQKGVDRASKKHSTSGPTSQKGKEAEQSGMDIDDAGDGSVDPEPPKRPPSRTKPRRKARVAEKPPLVSNSVNQSRKRKHPQVLDSEDDGEA